MSIQLVKFLLLLPTMDVKNKNLIKIAIVGPESTGKSTMAKFLAKEFNTYCVPEYSRYYCKNLNNSYTLQDEINMMHGQIALEDAMLDVVENNIIIFDTTILTVKVWSDHLFHHTPDDVLKEIKDRKYDLYLLMDIDLPWENDPLRDFPDKREHFKQIWIKELESIQANYVVISSTNEERLKKGLYCCENFIKNNHK